MFWTFLKQKKFTSISNKCHGFDFNRVKYQIIPDLYPPKLCISGENYSKLNMKKLSFYKLKTGSWTKKNAEYLYTSVNNCLKLYLWIKNCLSYEKINPKMVELPQFPFYWSLNNMVDLFIFIDVYMHILIFGCMKVIVSIIKSCLK